MKEGDRTGFIAGKVAMQHYHAQWYSYKEISVDFSTPVWHILYPGAGKVDVNFAESTSLVYLAQDQKSERSLDLGQIYYDGQEAPQVFDR